MGQAREKKGKSVIVEESEIRNKINYLDKCEVQALGAGKEVAENVRSHRLIRHILFTVTQATKHAVIARHQSPCRLHPDRHR